MNSACMYQCFGAGAVVVFLFSYEPYCLQNPVLFITFSILESEDQFLWRSWIQVTGR